MSAKTTFIIDVIFIYLKIIALIIAKPITLKLLISNLQVMRPKNLGLFTITVIMVAQP